MNIRSGLSKVKTDYPGYLALVIIAGLLIPFPNFIDELIMEPLTNIFHLPIGFTGVLLIHYFLNADGAKIPSPFSGAFTLLCAGLIEILQEFVGRSASFEDIFITFWGILAGIATIELLSDKTEKKRPYFILLSISTLIGLLVSIPPIFSGYALYNMRESYYPVLLQASTGLPKLCIPVEYTQLSINPQPDCAIRISSIPDQWSGFELPVGYKNWEHFNSIEIEVSNLSDKETTFLVRIDDSEDSTEIDMRFQISFSLTQNEKKTFSILIEEIPPSVTGKKFNLQEIERLLLVMNESQIDRELCVSSISLK
jgi:hypothetical protein